MIILVYHPRHYITVSALARPALLDKEEGEIKMTRVQIINDPLHCVARFYDQSRPTLLLLHGLLTDSSEWSKVIPYLEPMFNLIVCDLTGHGLSPAGDRPITIASEAEKIGDLLQQLQIERVHLIGSGVGGNIAFAFARKHPRNAASLVLIATKFYFEDDAFKHFFTLVAQLLDIDRRLLIRKVLVDSFCHPTAAAEKYLEKTVRRISAATVRHTVAAARAYFAPSQFRRSKIMPSFAVPTLVLHGNRDPIFPASLAAINAAFFPGNHFLTVAECGHYPAFEQPEQTAGLIGRFLDRDRRRPSVRPIYQEFLNDLRQVLTAGFQALSSQRHVLRMNVMDSVQVLWNGVTVEGKWNQRSAKELLLFLILHGGKASRQQLIRTFLSNLPPLQARNYLRVEINHLNQIFHGFHDINVYDVLLIGEGTITVNAEVESDLGDYLHALRHFSINREHLCESADQFACLLRQYNPTHFSTFRGDWIFELADRIESELSRVLQSLLPQLEAAGQNDMMRDILQVGRAVEPYDGFCDEQLIKLHGEMNNEWMLNG
ncbi:MAG: alpha/beta hydrolase [Sporolactobacillus sp.]|jgi:pimeloyl-ACP methyl ester carboxylesterase|nr:alpha/beta hydrolase [Sporolactobacillus sp.]